MVDVKEQNMYNLRTEDSGSRVAVVKPSGGSILAMFEAQTDL